MSLRNSTKNGKSYLPPSYARQKRISQCRSRGGNWNVCDDLNKYYMIKAIIFDLWETLGTKNIGISKVFFEHFSVPPEKRVLEKYEKAVQLKIWNSEEDMVRSLLRDFDISLAKENIIWTQNLFREGIEKATLFPGTLELLESIRGRYRLALISNTSIFESKVLDKLKIRNFFDVISFSWEIGILKPSVELFEQTLQKL